MILRILLLACVVLANAQTFDQDFLQKQLFSSTSSDLSQTRAVLPDNGPYPQEPVNDTTYIVGPGDQFTIVLTGRISEDQYNITVDAQGSLRVPKLGTVQTGKQLLLVKKDLLALFAEKTKGSTATIQLVKVKPVTIPVSGAVSFPGTYSFSSTVRLAEVIQKALSRPSDSINYPSNISSRNIQVISKDGAITSYDYDNFIANGDVKDNPFLAPGDRIVVPIRTKNLVISGAVPRSGIFDYHETSLYDAIRFVGGFKPNADSTEIQVTSYLADGIKTETRLYKYPDQCKSYIVQPDDDILIRSRPNWHEALVVSVAGRVQHPGRYTLQKGSTVKDLMVACGGLLEDADSTISILNRSSFLAKEYKNPIMGDLPKSELFIPSILSVSINPDAPLYSGDAIEFPKKMMCVSVVGSVPTPGLVNLLARNAPWTDYVDAAGGFDNNAYRSYAKIFKRKHLAWVLANDVETIEGGDVIYIPSKPVEFPWNRFKDMIALTGGILGIAGSIYYFSK